MDNNKLLVARIADTAGSWLAIAIASVVLLDDSLFGVLSETEPRVIESAIGIAAGIVICLGMSFVIANYPRVASVVKVAVIAALSTFSVVEKLNPFPFSIMARFAALVVAALLAWIDAARARNYEETAMADGKGSGSNVHVALVIAALLAGGSLWQQRENLYIWSSTLESLLCGVTGSIAVMVSVVLLHVESNAGNREVVMVIATSEADADRFLGTASLLSLFLGIACGLYMSLSMLVAQNTAFEYPSRVVYGINAGIAIIVVVITLFLAYYSRFAEQGRRRRIFFNAPGGLAVLLTVTVVTVGLPYMLATLDLADFTTAGTLHVTGLVAVPLVGYFMLSRLAHIKKTGGYAALVGSFGGLGLVIGIAGYLVGGNTYNMDFYVGMAYTILLGLGVLTAWLYKPQAGGQERIVITRPGSNIEGVQA